MKFTRKLIPALAMLVVSATMMSTASFAWFSMNKTVYANGMQVQASAPANLHIGDGFVAVDSCTATEIQLTQTLTTLEPTKLVFETNKLTAQKPATWQEDQNATPGFAGKPATYNNVGTLTGAKSGEVANLTASTMGSYISYDEMTVVRKSSTTGRYDLSADVVLTNVDANVNIWKALKVGFLVSVDQGDTWTWTYVATNVDAVLDGEKATFATLALGEDFADNNAVSVAFVVWYDGDDADCIANNALKTDALTINITFNSIDS